MSKKQVRISKRPGTAVRTPDDWVQDDRGTDREGRGGAGSVPPEKMKRLTIDVPETLHARIKVECARGGKKMADEVRALLESRFPPDREGPSA